MLSVSIKLCCISGDTLDAEIFYFSSGMSLMEGKEDIFAECREKFWPTLMVSIQFVLYLTRFNILNDFNSYGFIYIILCSVTYRIENINY